MTLKRFTSPDLNHSVLWFARAWPATDAVDAKKAWELGMAQARNTNIWRILRPSMPPHTECIVIGMGEVPNGTTMRRMLDAVLSVPGSVDDELDPDFLNGLLKRRLRTMAQRLANRDFGAMEIRDKPRRLDKEGGMHDA